jgi:ketosteroid isomerase-like protein
MKMKTQIFAILLFAIMLAFSHAAQDTPPPDATSPNALSKSDSAVSPAEESADRDQLRLLREALTEAVIKNDITTQLQFVHDDVVTTWQNNQVARGRDGLKKFMDEMNSGEDRVFQGYTVPPSTDDLAIMNGGTTAIAFGKSVPHYKYLGREFDLENRWTATLVKKDGQWKIAAYHVSANMTDNPILNAALNSIVWAVIISLLIGLLVGIVGTKLLRKKRSYAA